MSNPDYIVWENGWHQKSQAMLAHLILIWKMGAETKMVSHPSSVIMEALLLSFVSSGADNFCFSEKLFFRQSRRLQIFWPDVSQFVFGITISLLNIIPFKIVAGFCPMNLRHASPLRRCYTYRYSYRSCRYFHLDLVTVVHPDINSNSSAIFEVGWRIL